MVIVKYQRISFDWDVADGTYTPAQLRKARRRMIRWGEEREPIHSPETYMLVTCP